MTVAKAKGKVLMIVIKNIVQGSLMIVTYDRHNNFIAHATNLTEVNILQSFENDVMIWSPEKFGEVIEPGISGWRYLLTVYQLEPEPVGIRLLVCWKRDSEPDIWGWARNNMAKYSVIRENVAEPDWLKNFWTTQILIESFLVFTVLLISFSKNTHVLISRTVISTHAISSFC